MTSNEQKLRKEIGMFLYTQRKKRNLTQVEVSKVLKCSQGSLSKLESGESPISAFQWFRFAKLTKTPVQALASIFE